MLLSSFCVWLMPIFWQMETYLIDAASRCPTNCQCKDSSDNSSLIRIKCGGTAETSISRWEEINLTEIAPFVISLDLSNNAFTTAQSQDFSNFTQLKRLDFSSNLFRKIDKDTFGGALPNLERLKLSNNSIRHIYSGSFELLQNLKQLDVSNNPLVCNCDLVWLLAWTNSHLIKLQPSPKCESPIYFKGTLLKKLKVGVDLHCESPLQTLLELLPINNQVAFEGDELIMKCRAPRVAIEVPRESEDISTTHIFWGWSEEVQRSNSSNDMVYKDPEKVFRDVDISTKHISDSGILNSVLRIGRISKQHSGKWVCTLNSQQANLSKSIAVVVISKETTYCNVSVVRTNKGTYYWPQTIRGQIVSQPCVENEEKNLLVTYSCNEYGKWENLNTSLCPFVSETTRILEQISKMNVSLTKKNAFEIAERLHNFTRTQIYLNNVKDSVDLEFITRALKKYIDYVPYHQDISYIILSIVSELLLLPKFMFEEAQAKYQTSLNMLNIVETASSHIQSLPPSSQELTLDSWSTPWNIFLDSFNIHVDSFTGISCIWLNSATNMGRRSFECSTANDTFAMFEKRIDAAIHIPVNNLFDKSDKSLRLMVSVFRNGNLLSNSYKNNSSEDIKGSLLTSVVIGAKVAEQLDDLQALNDISEKMFVMLRVHPFHNEISSPIPAWWDSDIKDWNPRVCRKLYFHRGLLLFTCRRLGYYGLLQHTEYLNDYATDGSGARFKLAPTSIYIGSLVVFFCAWINIVTFIIFRKAIRMNRQQIHSLVNIWLSVSLLVAVFALGIFQTENQYICRIVGILLHYFSLSVLLWLCVYLSNLYKGLSKTYRLTTEPDVPKDIKLKKSILSIYLVGWGIGTIICGISSAVNINEYATYSFCFLNNTSSLNALLVPAIILIIFLAILMLCVFCHLNHKPLHILESTRFGENTVVTENIDLDWLDLKQSAAVRGSQNFTGVDQYKSLTLSNPVSSLSDDLERSSVAQLRAHFIFLILFIISWISAAIFINQSVENVQSSTVFSIVFAISSSLLGLFLITFYTLSRNDTRSAWGRRFCLPNVLCKSYQKKYYGTPVATTMHAHKSSTFYDASTSRSRTNSQCSRHHSNSVRSMKSNSHKNDQIIQNISCPLLGTVSSNVNQAAIINNQHKPNSLAVVPMTCEIPSAEIFYNPNQIIVARKFFKKQKRLAKRNNFELQRQVDRVGYLENASDISSLSGSEVSHIYSKRHNAITLLRGGSKVNNTNICYKSNPCTNYGSKSPYYKPIENSLHLSGINSDCFPRNPSSNFIANIYTNIPETKEPKHEIIKVRNHNKPSCTETLSEHEEEVDNESNSSLNDKKCPLYQNTSEVSSPNATRQTIASSSLAKPPQMINEDIEVSNACLPNVKELHIDHEQKINEFTSTDQKTRHRSKHSKSLNNLVDSVEQSNRFLKKNQSNNSLIASLEQEEAGSWNSSSVSVSLLVNESQRKQKNLKLKKTDLSGKFEFASENNVFNIPHAVTAHSVSPTNESDFNYQNSEISIKSHDLYEPQPDNDLNMTLTEEFPYQSSNTSDTEDQINDFDDENLRSEYLGHRMSVNDQSIDELYEAIKHQNLTVITPRMELSSNINGIESSDETSTPFRMAASETLSLASNPTTSSRISSLSKPFLEASIDTLEDDSSQSSVISYIDKKGKKS
uniref:G-protein coupled receptor 124 n=1 Tax=Ceratitis capitata TaxID=7213 RepID=W8BNX9_CERCA